MLFRRRSLPRTKHKGQSTKNGATRYYTWGRDLSGTLQGAGGVGGLLSIRIENANSESEVLYPSYDANGNITDVIDRKGQVRAAFQYGPFGNLISEAGDLAEQVPFRFSTKHLDQETGLYYYGFRYYAPDMAHWLSSDPVQELGGLNLYAFALNQPIHLIDRYGLAAFPPKPTKSKRSYGCCGGIIDEWYAEELKQLMNGWDQYISDWRESTNTLRVDVSETQAFLDWIYANADYKNAEAFQFNKDIPCGTQPDAGAPSGQGCGMTVTLCGNCIKTSTLGNISYGFMVHYASSRSSQIDAGNVTTAVNTDKRRGAAVAGFCLAFQDLC